MHSLLETYLDEVAARLGPLPAKAQAEELREMRAHLETAFAAGLERGQSEDESARGVLAQFGTPDVVSTETVAAWRRGRGLDRRSFWGAAVLGFALLMVLPRLLTPWQWAFLKAYGSPHLAWEMGVFLLLSSGAECVLVGSIVGVISRRQAVAVAGATYAVRVLWGTALLGYHAAHAGHPVGFPLVFLLQITLYTVIAGLFCLLGAWMGSRWRTARTGRARVARG